MCIVVGYGVELYNLRSTEFRLSPRPVGSRGGYAGNYKIRYEEGIKTARDDKL